MEGEEDKTRKNYEEKNNRGPTKANNPTKTNTNTQRTQTKSDKKTTTTSTTTETTTPTDAGCAICGESGDDRDRGKGGKKTPRAEVSRYGLI
jgi:outer membrane biosynthesis protein TonB